MIVMNLKVACMGVLTYLIMMKYVQSLTNKQNRILMPFNPEDRGIADINIIIEYCIKSKCQRELSDLIGHLKRCVQSVIGLIDDLPSNDEGTSQDIGTYINTDSITSNYNSQADAIHDEETTDVFTSVDTSTDEPTTHDTIDICVVCAQKEPLSEKYEWKREVYIPCSVPIEQMENSTSI